jgi:hypothetical protein
MEHLLAKVSHASEERQISAAVELARILLLGDAAPEGAAHTLENCMSDLRLSVEQVRMQACFVPELRAIVERLASRHRREVMQRITGARWLLRKRLAQIEIELVEKEMVVYESECNMARSDVVTLASDETRAEWFNKEYPYLLEAVQEEQKRKATPPAAEPDVAVDESKIPAALDVIREIFSDDAPPWPTCRDALVVKLRALEPAAVDSWFKALLGTFDAALTHWMNVVEPQERAARRERERLAAIAADEARAQFERGPQPPQNFPSGTIFAPEVSGSRGISFRGGGGGDFLGQTTGFHNEIAPAGVRSQPTGVRTRAPRSADDDAPSLPSVPTRRRVEDLLDVPDAPPPRVPDMQPTPGRRRGARESETLDVKPADEPRGE